MLLNGWLLLLVIGSGCVSSSSAVGSFSSTSVTSNSNSGGGSGSNNGLYAFDPTRHYSEVPISLQSGIGKIAKRKWDQARSLAVLEQAVEDYNAEIVATAPDAVSAISYRRLIALPLDERFDPPMGVFSHGHVQTGDKMSLPACFWPAIQKSGAEVPWLFEVSRISDVTGERAIFGEKEHDDDDVDPGLNRVVGGAIDFRSPSNYVFLPRWMMLALALKPRDVVDVRLKQDVPSGSAVQLRPHTTEFTKIANHQAVLETELKHYSALTRGSTIPFDYNKQRYYFDVVDLRSAPRGEKVPMAKVQDCDIAAEFVRPKDQLQKKQQRANNKKNHDNETDSDDDES
eukprot:CAMPEP_0197829600 /NCGR_PEP_ID=MMETSP1437-20131217/6112_1 /TAXON_ID=49252 ORGANISM="Eucampia antarctica, Strain CCMP1452" /NCGR_SAMPLE_ID=MMETSP1437 /ASSEMBLY_ACC=CAM_ASM_001096 /LENGTH=342 /DNA_ID=CAMNT_0043431401 /DNA_START=46 /DNA_END=1074 /DNA_ORIENTATION=-